MRSRSMSIITPIIFFASLTAMGQTTATYSIPEQWEYKITGCLPEPELNKLGEQGWELVSVQWYETTCRIFYLKRAKGQGANITPPPLPPPKAPSCNLTLAQAPVIYGFRLGMSTDELLEMFPRSKDNPDIKQLLARAEIQYGSTNLNFSRDQYPDSQSFVNNISHYGFGLLDGRVISIFASYRFSENPNWTANTWTDKISEKLNLPARGNWSGNDGDNKNIVCQGFSVYVYAQDQSTSVTISTPDIGEIINSRRNAVFEKRRREFKP